MQLRPEQLRSWQRFLKLWPIVHAELERGYTIRAVHEALIGEGAWSSGYDVFRRHVARARRQLPSPAAQLPARGKRQAQSLNTTPRQPPPNSELAQRLESIKSNTLDEKTERDPYDHSGMSPEAQELM